MPEVWECMVGNLNIKFHNLKRFGYKHGKYELWSETYRGYFLFDIKIGYIHFHVRWLNPDKKFRIRVRCRLCKHEWWSRVENVKQCPKCKRYDWDKEK
jgi:hypothetical protein